MSAYYTPIGDLVKKLQNTKYSSKPKEAEPIPALKEKFEIREAVEHKIEEEVKPFVQTRAEIIDVPPDLAKMGLQPVTTTQFPAWQNIKAPLSDDKIVSGLHAPVSSSVRWLAELARYILFQAHIGLRVIHGKIVRVISS